MSTNQTMGQTAMNQQVINQNQGGNNTMLQQQQPQVQQQVPTYTINPQQVVQSQAAMNQGGNNTMLQQQQQPQVQQQVPSYIRVGNDVYQLSKVPQSQQNQFQAIQTAPVAVMPNINDSSDEDEGSFFDEHPIISTALLAGTAYVGYKVVSSLFFNDDDSQTQEEDPALYFDEMNLI